MNPQLIPTFIQSLQGRKSTATAINPYENSYCRRNLTKYLETLCSFAHFSGHLFIGICPGEHGCAITGIPFTDETTLIDGGHPFLDAMGITPAGSARENAAQEVWRQARQQTRIAAFWNVFPFRKLPRNDKGDVSIYASERDEGRPYLLRVIEILAPHTLVAVGDIPKQVVPKVAKERGLNAELLGYPSGRGNLGEFRQGYYTLVSSAH